MPLIPTRRNYGKHCCSSCCSRPAALVSQQLSPRLSIHIRSFFKITTEDNLPAKESFKEDDWTRKSGLNNTQHTHLSLVYSVFPSPSHAPVSVYTYLCSAALKITNGLYC